MRKRATLLRLSTYKTPVASTPVAKRKLCKLPLDYEDFSSHFAASFSETLLAQGETKPTKEMWDSGVFSKSEIEDIRKRWSSRDAERYYKSQSVSGIDDLTQKLWPLADNFYLAGETFVFRLLIDDKTVFLSADQVLRYRCNTPFADLKTIALLRTAHRLLRHFIKHKSLFSNQNNSKKYKLFGLFS